MLGLIQRVSSASVTIDGMVTGEIDRGLLLLLGVQKEDNSAVVDKLLDKVLKYRVFPDAEGHMNLGLAEVGGGLLIVSQFTLAANTRKGLRPSFSSAAPPELAERMYDEFLEKARAMHPVVASGKFGADMKVALVNDGPVTFLLAT